MHEVLVNRLGGLSLSRKSVVRLTDRPDMTLDVYRGRKTTMQQQQQIRMPVKVTAQQLNNVGYRIQTGWIQLQEERKIHEEEEGRTRPQPKPHTHTCDHTRYPTRIQSHKHAKRYNNTHIRKYVHAARTHNILTTTNDGLPLLGEAYL